MTKYRIKPSKDHRYGNMECWLLDKPTSGQEPLEAILDDENRTPIWVYYDEVEEINP